MLLLLIYGNKRNLLAEKTNPCLFVCQTGSFELSGLGINKWLFCPDESISKEVAPYAVIE